MSRSNKSVSFNTNDELDIELLAHAEKINNLTGKPRNFSKYVKKLIEDDLNRSKGVYVNPYLESKTDDTEEYSEETKSNMKSFL